MLINKSVATALTACGIETTAFLFGSNANGWLQQHLPLAVLKLDLHYENDGKSVKLQQHLPLAVLKPETSRSPSVVLITLQQHLPLAVLKPFSVKNSSTILLFVATALTACGIETRTRTNDIFENGLSCNSTYRLRY